MSEDDVLAKIKKFFVEHPLHEFSTGAISKHIRVDPLKVAIVITKLYKDNYLSPLWSLSDKDEAVANISKQIVD